MVQLLLINMHFACSINFCVLSHLYGRKKIIRILLFARRTLLSKTVKRIYLSWISFHRFHYKSFLGQSRLYYPQNFPSKFLVRFKNSSHILRQSILIFKFLWCETCSNIYIKYNTLGRQAFPCKQLAFKVVFFLEQTA